MIDGIFQSVAQGYAENRTVRLLLGELGFSFSGYSCAIDLKNNYVIYSPGLKHNITFLSLAVTGTILYIAIVNN